MSYSMKVTSPPAATTVPYSQIPVGRFVRFPHETEILLKTYVGLISLEDPRRTWTYTNADKSLVLLPEGFKVEITAGDLGFEVAQG